MVKIIECPRDAMQGLAAFIPTSVKIDYLNALLDVGFDTLDLGSFVSPKAVPQMKDTADIIPQLKNTATKKLVIIANERGAIDACTFDSLHYLGFPLSVSEIFQKKNTGKTIADALDEIKKIQSHGIQHGKELVVYLSMAFGNPYGEAYSIKTIFDLTKKLHALGISIISIADTVGVASPEQIKTLAHDVLAAYPSIEWGVHLHATPQTASEKIAAVFSSGIQRIDSALLGFGGCPLADNPLVGNLDTRQVVDYCVHHHIPLSLMMEKFNHATALAQAVFQSHK